MKKLYTLLTLAALVAAGDMNAMLVRVGQAAQTGGIRALLAGSQARPSLFAPRLPQTAIRGMRTQYPSLSQRLLLQQAPGKKAFPAFKQTLPTGSRMFTQGAQGPGASDLQAFTQQITNTLKQNPELARQALTGLGIVGAGASLLKAGEVAAATYTPEEVLKMKLSERGIEFTDNGAPYLPGLIDMAALEAINMDLFSIEDLLKAIPEEKIRNILQSKIISELRSDAKSLLEQEKWSEAIEQGGKSRYFNLTWHELKEMNKNWSSQFEKVGDEIRGARRIPHPSGVRTSNIKYLKLPVTESLLQKISAIPDQAEILNFLNIEPLYNSNKHKPALDYIVESLASNFRVSESLHPTEKKLLDLILTAKPELLKMVRTRAGWRGNSEWFTKEFLTTYVSTNPAFNEYLQKDAASRFFYKPTPLNYLWYLARQLGPLS